MSVAALRFRPSSTDVELTKQGFLIYYGDAFSFHEWEFRTTMRYEATKAEDRWELGSKVLEGLRGDAYAVAEDLGSLKLKSSDAVPALIEAMRRAVFTLKEHEAKELYRMGTSIGGPLSRQAGESMTQYISRRKRWWRKVKELDEKLQVSDTILTDLLMDNANLNRSEKLMILTTVHDSPTFESVSEALLRQHGKIHLRESRQSSQHHHGKAAHKGVKGFGKGKRGFKSKSHAHVADEDYDYDGYDEDYDYAYTANDDFYDDYEEDEVEDAAAYAATADESTLTAEAIELDVLACFLAYDTFDEDNQEHVSMFMLNTLLSLLKARPKERDFPCSVSSHSTGQEHLILASKIDVRS